MRWPWRALRCGGPVPDQGSFFAPTVLLDTPVHARVMQEEPFGPLAPVTPFDTLDEALAIANANPYGLAGYLFTDSARVREACAQRLEVGFARGQQRGGVGAGRRHSAASRTAGSDAESGVEGMESFLDTRTVHSVAS